MRDGPDDLHAQRATPAFLAGGGESTRRIMARDWSGHPLGLPETWPEALKVSLSLILNSPESMILCWDAEALFFFFNDTYVPLLGPRATWATGERFDRVWSDAWEQAQPIIGEALAGRSKHYDDLPWKLDTDRGVADTWFSFSYSRVLSAEGEPAGLFILTNETTARVLADKALAESQAELRALNDDLEVRVEERTAERDRLWNTSPDLLVIVDFGGFYTAVNPAWTRILGWSQSELIGIGALDLVHPDDLAATQAGLETAIGGVLPPFSNRLRHMDGSWRWISWTAAPSGKEVVAVGRDITDARDAADVLARTEDQLRQSQKVEAIGQLTGGVAHDFNNMLTVIRGSVDMLRRPNISEERRIRYTDAIAETSDRASKLTSQLLAFARRQALDPEVFDVGAGVAVVQDMIRTLSGSRIEVELQPAERPLHVHADRNQFDTALLNLASNARDAMNGQGRLTIGVRPVSNRPETLEHPAQDGAFVAISIADTGPGIAADQVQKIFEPFYTTKAVGEGTGLGLSQVIGFARQSGGDVAVDPAPGGGARFTLYLPVAEASSMPVQTEEAGDHKAADRDLCLLVVEDNPQVGSFATEALREIGYRTVFAADAQAALRELEHDADRFDAVFSDVVMPGASGVELAGEVRRRWPDLPVILTSGYSPDLAESAGVAFPLLNKPYSMEELAAFLREAVGRRPRVEEGS